MIRSIRNFLWTALLLATATSGFAQNWALPAKTPETPVPCTICSDAGALSVGYKLPFSTFTGRYLDSSSTRDYQATFRTARAWNVLFVPATNRVYFRIGSSVGAYNAEVFFKRLEAGESLMPVSQVPVNPRSGRAPSPDEKWLKWDEFFYPEYIGSGWQVNHMDGQERIMGFDADDQGYVYIAASSFGWGIVKDGLTVGSGTLMASQFQKYPGDTDFPPFRIMAVRGSGTKNYVLVASSGAGMTIWDATDRKAPVRIASRAVGLKYFAKNTAGNIAGIVDWAGNLNINTGDGIAAGSTPLFSGTGYNGVASDGTNFFAVKTLPSGPAISVIVPSGSGYTEQQKTYQIRNGMSAYNLRYGDGYLTVTGSTNSFWDMEVMKVSNLVPAEVAIDGSPSKPSLPSYFINYYSSPPTGYVAPESSYINMIDGTTYRSATSGKTYVIVCAKGLGDVYELKGSDSVTVTGNGTFGTVNPSAPAASSKVYYGDPVSFTASTSTQSASVSNVVWNFGNPESGTSLNTQQTSQVNLPMVRPYFSTTPGGIATTMGSKAVVATSLSDSSIKGSTAVTIGVPGARFGIAGTGTKYLFTQPNASSPAPIVLGDSFVDASDGLVEGHYASWTIDGINTKSLPNVPISVGACGQHTVQFLAMYGPYAASGGTFLPDQGAANYAVGLGTSNGSVTYGVRPFAAAIDTISSTATSITFGSASRGLLTGVVFHWELVDSSGALVQDGGAGTSFAVPQTAISGTRGRRVRLTLTSPTAVACTGMETSVAYSTPLNAPDPVVTKSGDCNGAPCTFTATSSSGVDTAADAWAFNWEVLNAGTGALDTTSYTSASGTHTSVFNPTFIKAGSFTVRLTVTNAISSATVSNAVSVTTPSTSCKTMGANSFTVAVSCSPCTAGQTATFVANNYEYLTGGYDATCSTHTYTWAFPDGGTGTGQSVERTVSLGGTVNVSISNGVQTKTYSGTLTVGSGGGGGGGGGGGNPGGDNPCGPFTSANVFISYSGAGGCSTGIACNKGISIQFSADPYGYSFDCAGHTFSWNFGDGSGSAGGRTVAHTFTSEGLKTLSLTITSPYAVVTKTSPITIAGTGTGTNPCGTMNSTNVGITFSGPTSSCSEISGTACKNNETLNFDAAAYLGYSFSCATHTFSWDFGDGGTATGKTASHAFATSGSHAVKLTVSNPYQLSFLRQMSVTTNDGGPIGSCGTIQPNVNLAILYANASNTCGPLGSACAAGEVINFLVKDYAPYSISCGTHSYDWDFGDGSTHSNSATPSHQYQTGGTYTAKCTINNGSETKTLQQSVVITSGNPVTPPVEATISVTPMPGVANGYIFTGSAKPDGVVTRWVWNFGDNNTAEGRTQAHIYSNDDPRTVTLTVYNAQGQTVGTDNLKVPLASRRRSVRH